MKRNTPWAIAALVLGAIGISFASPLAKLAWSEGGVGWVASAFWRTAISMPVLWAAMLLARTRTTARHRHHRLWLLVPGGLFALDLLTWHLSFAWTTAASATLLANLGVILVGFIGWRFLRERLDARFAIGAALALGGVGWLVLGVPVSGAFPNRFGGDLLAMSTAVFYASYIVSIKVLRETYGAWELMAVAATASAVILLPSVWIAGEPILPERSEGWYWLLLLAVVPHCVGQGLIVLSLAALPASFAAVTLLLQPVATAVWGWTLLGEPLAATQIVAGCVVILGIVLARLGSGGRRLDGG